MPHNQKFQEAQQRYLANTNDAEAAWKLSQACFDLAETAANNARRADYANRGIAAAQRAVALNNGLAAGHYYLGMNTGELADTKHNLSGLRMVKDMEREFLAALVIDEHFDYGGPDRNLGLLYRDAPSIVSIGSRGKARQHLQKAVELAPDFPENRLNLIESYLKWDYHTEASRELENLEKIWPKAEKKFTGEAWASEWPDWNKRFANAKKKLENASKVTESPHSQ
jgi:tetratricopeptide (TPR) repeat protein